MTNVCLCYHYLKPVIGVVFYPNGCERLQEHIGTKKCPAGSSAYKQLSFCACQGTLRCKTLTLALVS